MMDLQKVKEALSGALDNFNVRCDCKKCEEKRHKIKEALEQFEKQADDDVLFFAERCLTVYEHESTEESCVRRISSLFQQFAESYHAKKCAECGKENNIWDIAPKEAIGAWVHPKRGIHWILYDFEKQEHETMYLSSHWKYIEKPLPEAPHA